MPSARICPADTRVPTALRDVRRSRGVSQTALAAALRVKQPHIAQFERQDDMHLSTLRRYVEALGGTLELVIRFPDAATGEIRPGRKPKTPNSNNSTQGSHHADSKP